MNKKTIDEIVAKLKELIAKGNVTRIIIRAKNGSEILNTPVNAGIIGGMLLLSAAKWVLIIGALTTVGLGCTVEVVKDNNEVTYVVKPEDAEKAQAVATVIVDEVKGAVGNIVSDVTEKAKSADDEEVLEVIDIVNKEEKDN